MSVTPGEDDPNAQSQPGYWEQQAQASGPPPQTGHSYGYGVPNQPGYPPYAAIAYQPPAHPEANKVLALGLVGLVGGVTCYLPIFVAPFAWVIGNRVTREIDAAGGRLRGRTEAQTGRILGIIGTCMLAAGVLLLVLVLVLAFQGTFDEPGNSNV